MEQTEILVKSTIDGSMQPSLFYKAKGEKRPLLVGLHTWSHNRFNQVDRMVPYAEKYDFNLVLPEFRGANLGENPICTEACGSMLAKQDIKDVVDYLKSTEDIDAENIFLLGASGGGHMALMMSGFCPEDFKAIGAFVPITNLDLWQKQNPNYRDSVLACCSSNEKEMVERSPINYIDTIAKANLKIFHGKFDPIVPFTHSVEIYNQIIAKYPDCRVFLDIFDGGHEMRLDTAMDWLMSQMTTVKKEVVTG